MKTTAQIVFITAVTAVLFSCSKFNKLVKSTDMNTKYDAAMAYYEKGDYNHALTLLEELITVFKGTEKAEKIYYYYSYCNYNVGDYILAGFHFKNYTKVFPNTSHTEECSFMTSYCFYLQSPEYTLDQTDTKAAMREMQLFVNKYPNSTRLEECNKLLDEMRSKLEKKAYENAKLYYFLQDYKAAVVSFANVMHDFPDSKYRAEMMYLTLKCNYLLAVNSIETKKEERILAAIESYTKFIDAFPNSKDLKSAESIYDSAIKMKNKINKNKI